MKQTLFTLCVAVTFSAKAQKIQLPVISGIDNSLHKAMPVVAKQVIPLYKEEDPATYWDNMLRYKLVAADYTGCIQALDSIQKQFENDTWEGNPALGIQFRSYALAKQFFKSDFDKTFTDTLASLYNRLPETAKPFTEQFFGADTASLRNNLLQQLERLKNADSVLLTEACTLLRTYNSWNVLTQTGVMAKNFLRAEDDKKYITQDSVLMPGSNSTKLSAVIVRSKKLTAPAPVVIMYNIYAGAGDKTIAKTAAEKGYVGIVINTRGKRNSPFATEPFEHDGADVYYALDWISKQPWCNGKAGMYGGSYLGFSQWSAAKKLHPVLKTIVPQVSVGIGIDYPMHNGIFMNYMLQWIHFVTNNKTTDLPEFNDHARWDSLNVKWYRTGKAFRSLDTLDGRPNAIFQRWLQHPQYDGFWQNMVPFEKEFAGINIPVLTTTGYFDDDQRGAFYYFNQHHKWNKNANHYLLIGPWNHSGAQSAAVEKLMGYTIDSVANININETVWQWFDYILKDSAKPAMLADKINYQVMGANQWRHVPSINAVSNQSLVFYMSDVLTKNGFKLQQALPASKKYITQEVDFTDRNDIVFKEQQVLDSVLDSNEKIKFVSMPLQEDVIMTGSLEGQLTFITNKKDADIAAYLFAQQPDGKYFLLSYTLQRASFIKNPKQRTLLQPGKEETLPLYNCFFTSKKIVKGSRLLLLVGVNKNYGWQINYGSGKDVSDETMADGTVPLQIQWSNHSYIKIPVSR
jgi:putative CocE/NonD family hydrolase